MNPSLEVIKMQFLGIRTSPRTIRYAIIDWNGQVANFLNANKENKIDFPAEIISPEQKVVWLFKEVQGILHKYSEVKCITIKINEFSPMGHESASSRESAYLDATIILASNICQKKVVMKSCPMMKIKPKEVIAFAEQNVGRSLKYWNQQMADAVVAAWSSRYI